MKNVMNQSVQGILLNDNYRSDGSAEINGKLVEWKAGYIIAVLPYGAKRATEARRFTVAKDRESEITEKLSLVGWGALIELELDEANHVYAVNVLLDWSDDIPLN